MSEGSSLLGCLDKEQQEQSFFCTTAAWIESSSTKAPQFSIKSNYLKQDLEKRIGTIIIMLKDLSLLENSPEKDQRRRIKL